MHDALEAYRAATEATFSGNVVAWDASKLGTLTGVLELTVADEGVVQLCNPIDGTPPIVGVIGALQLDVLADRLQHEYGLASGFDTAPCETIRWISADDPAVLKTFMQKYRPSIALDLDGAPVFMGASSFNQQWTADKNPEISFTDIKTVTA